MLTSSIILTTTPGNNKFGETSSFISEDEKKSGTFVDYIVSNVYVFCLSIYALWILLGILWYVHYDKWTYATAYYFAMEAGLSIGFCYPSEVDDWSKLFTIFYVLIGSSAVSGALGVFCSVVLFARPAVARDYSLENMTVKDPIEDRITCRSFFNYYWYRFKLAIGWYTDRTRTMSVILFIIWEGLGTTYGMVVEKWTFITSLYWAINTSATGGLQSAPCVSDPKGDGTTCDMGTMRGSFMGVFIMVGVPLYAWTLSQFGRMAVRRTVESRQAKLISAPIDEGEFLFAANVLSPAGSDSLVLGEYILLELIRLKQTDRSQIERLKQNFYKLDRHNKGELFIDDLRCVGKVVTKRVRPGSVVQKLRTTSVEIFDFLSQSPVKRRSNPAAFTDSTPNANPAPATYAVKEAEQPDADIACDYPERSRHSVGRKSFQKSVLTDSSGGADRAGMSYGSRLFEFQQQSQSQSLKGREIGGFNRHYSDSVFDIEKQQQQKGHDPGVGGILFDDFYFDGSTPIKTDGAGYNNSISPVDDGFHIGDLSLRVSSSSDDSDRDRDRDSGGNGERKSPEGKRAVRIRSAESTEFDI